MKTRDDATIGIGEDFVYDSLNRLTSATVDYQSAKSATYSAAGDINTKSECGTYYYASRPHLVTGTSGCESSFTYDANSRMITRGSGEIDWYTYDLPSRIDDPTDSVYSQFWYGPDRSRIKQYQSDTGATITYVGALFEYEDTSSTDTARYYVHAGSRVVAMVERVGSTNTTQYLHRDQQNSITKITSSGGSVTESLAYDAWGLRRNPSTWAALGSPFSGSHETDRGYTGHVHLDNVGLIHMNGRVQDPRLGRFISADPFVAEPFNTQSHNRYSYVWNNPASMIDPSGFFPQWLCLYICSGGGNSGGDGVRENTQSCNQACATQNAEQTWLRMELQQMVDRQNLLEAERMATVNALVEVMGWTIRQPNERFAQRFPNIVQIDDGGFGVQCYIGRGECISHPDPFSIAFFDLDDGSSQMFGGFGVGSLRGGRGPGITNPLIAKLTVPPVPSGFSPSSFGKNLIGWGIGAQGAVARLGSLTASDVVRMQTQGLTRKMVGQWRALYANDILRNANNATAAKRIELLDAILNLMN